jgi:hypothetical protein
MADIILSSCCYTQLVYSATSWSYTTTPLSAFNITGDTNIPDGCYTIVTGVTAFGPFSFDGTATVITDCSDPSCSGYCGPEEFCISVSLSAYTGYNGTYLVSGSTNGYPYWQGGTTPGYLYFNNTNWCLSTSISGNCDFFGPNPTTSLLPD